MKGHFLLKNSDHRGNGPLLIAIVEDGGQRTDQLQDELDGES